MIRLVVFAAVAAMVYVVVKRYTPEFAAFSELFAVVAVLLFLLPDLLSLLNFTQDFFDAAGVERDYFIVLMKITGIAILTQFASDTCRDCGEAALASQAEFAGKVLMVVNAMPVIKAVIQTAFALFENG